MRLRALIATAAALGLAAVGTSAQATVLLPGTNTPVAVDGTSHTAANLTADFGSVVASQLFAFSTGTFTGTLLQEVRVTNGTVTFDYKVTNTGPSTDDIARLSTGPLKGLGTNVFTTSGSTNINNYSADRKGAAGNAVGFNFSLPTPQTTAYLIIRTTASAFNHKGTVTVSDGTSQSFTAYGAVVPEPGTAVLSALSLGIVGLGSIGFRRRSAGK